MQNYLLKTIKISQSYSQIYIVSQKKSKPICFSSYFVRIQADSCGNFIQNTVYQISPESAKFYRRYDKSILAHFFLGHGVDCHVLMAHGVYSVAGEVRARHVFAQSVVSSSSNAVINGPPSSPASRCPSSRLSAGRSDRHATAVCSATARPRCDHPTSASFWRC